MLHEVNEDVLSYIRLFEVMCMLYEVGGGFVSLCVVVEGCRSIKGVCTGLCELI